MISSARTRPSRPSSGGRRSSRRARRATSAPRLRKKHSRRRSAIGRTSGGRPPGPRRRHPSRARRLWTLAGPRCAAVTSTQRRGTRSRRCWRRRLSRRCFSRTTCTRTWRRGLSCRGGASQTSVGVNMVPAIITIHQYTNLEEGRLREARNHPEERADENQRQLVLLKHRMQHPLKLLPAQLLHLLLEGLLQVKRLVAVPVHGR
mmetsp:Transcript_13605/g.55043  ORF Transcript_13605/g.55043 Transcript_13605/m.55043 type:complete len:204 (-) Transcript_13605:1631-2242(-)